MDNAKQDAGRPVALKGGKKITLYLDAETIKKARSLGDGNISAGIRKSVAICSVSSQS